MNTIVLKKLMSVTAWCVLILVIVLCFLTWKDSVTWKDVFSNALFSFIGFYVGRNRLLNEGVPPK